MRKTYPATAAHKRVLKDIPKPMNCLPRDASYQFQALSNTVIFLWLVNGTGFWYHLQRASGSTLTGYALMDTWWRYTPVSRGQILRFY